MSSRTHNKHHTSLEYGLLLQHLKEQTLDRLVEKYCFSCVMAVNVLFLSSFLYLYMHGAQ